MGHESGYLEQDDVETTLKRKMDFVLPDDWKTSANAVNMGAPLLLHAPRSKLRLAYKAIAQELANDGAQTDDPGTPGATRGAEVEGGNAGGGGRKGLFSIFGGGKVTRAPVSRV